MRILVNAMSARQGGGITYIRNLFGSEPYHEIVLITSGNIDLDETLGVKVISLGVVGRNPVLRVLAEVLILPLILIRYKSKILFCPGGVSYTFTLPPGVKLITMFRNVLPFADWRAFSNDGLYQLLRNLALRHLMTFTFRRADSVIFISKHAKSMIESKVVLKRSTVIYHGLSASFYCDDDNRPATKDSGLRFLYVSKFLEYKNQLSLLKAIKRDPEHLNHQFLFVGETGGAYYDECLKFCAENALGEVVRFLGPIDYSGIQNIYADADAIVFLSSQENCPNILLESMAVGRPIICSNIQPMPEFAEGAVVYVDPYRIDQISAAISAVIADSALRLRYGRRARRRSFDFSWDTTRLETFIHFMEVGR